MYEKSKKKKPQDNSSKNLKLLDTESRLVVAKAGGGWGGRGWGGGLVTGRKWVKGIIRYKLPVIK